MIPISSSPHPEFYGLQRISYSSLPWEEKFTVMWGWFWKTYVVYVGVWAMAGTALSAGIAAITEMTGPINTVASAVINLILAAIIGFFATQPLIMLIVNSKIGNYRIILCKVGVPDETPNQGAATQLSKSNPNANEKTRDTANA